MRTAGMSGMRQTGTRFGPVVYDIGNRHFGRVAYGILNGLCDVCRDFAAKGSGPLSGDPAQRNAKPGLRSQCPTASGSPAAV